ncbi:MULTISPECIES: peptidase domain-containing ABC transporter [Pelosinus]|uniref:Type I secretion system ATPase n=1 Tax=Pelosinus fermentans B4 TaxID=1149862 RepID=I9B6Y3_9FIRM|nr:MULTISPECIES: type I secretion system permease/ATPase [Pelosinus]EIW20877.1 type I secretion system ATPase [Pelosinus fermentans B4]EIW27256.1 type I secretion system ATPase [Pelosinus fermentans A11]
MTIQTSKQKKDCYEGEVCDTALQCLIAVANTLKVSVDEKKIRESYSDKVVMDIQLLLKSAKFLKLKTKVIKPKNDELGNLPIPAIAVMRDGTFQVIGKNNKERIVAFDPQVRRPKTIPLEEFLAAWGGEIITIKKTFSLKNAGQQFNLAWFIPIIVRYKHFFYEVLIASFFLQLFGLVTPLFTQVIIDKVLLHKGVATLDVLALALLFAAFFQMIMNLLRTYLSTHTTNKMDMILGAKLIRHLVTLPLRYFELRRVGDTLARVAALNGIREFLTGSTMTIFLDIFFSLLFILVMFYYSVSLTVIALISLPLYLVQNVIATPIYRERLQAVWSSGAESNAFLVEAITGVHTVKSLALEPQFNHKWETLLAKYISAAFNSAKFNMIVGGSGSLVQSLTGFAILLVGGHKVMNGEMTIGQLIAFQMLAGQASAPLFRLTGIWQSCQQAALSVERLGDILNTPPETFQKKKKEVPSMRGNVIFDNVNFRYHAEGKIILNQVSIQIQAGMRIGIVGRSGSGKSTMTKLVQRLYLPESGQVSIDGVDLAQVEPTWLRQRIGVVLQENFLFNGSVRDNIAIARPGVSIEEVIRAAQMSGAHEFILELPEGYDAKVGERGMSLSGGQQQRIAIARAILTNPAILIFDEATSALDYESERIIMNNLDAISAGRTMIMIAHRLSTVRRCDKIIVMERGQVVEQGTHEELISLNRCYYNLYKQQEV